MTFSQLNMFAQRNLADLATGVLDIETLEQRGSDSLDFHEIHVGILSDLLAKAYEMGRRGAR